MHYGLIVFLENDSGDITQKLVSAMAPFSRHLEVEPYRVYIDLRDIPELYTPDEWHGVNVMEDAQGCYYITTKNPNGKWDWWDLWKNAMPRNPCRVAQIPSNLIPWSFLDKDSVWHMCDVRGAEYDYSKMEVSEWREKWEAAKLDHADCIAVLVDYHT